MSKELIERLKWRFQIRNAMNADRTDPITCGLHRHSKPAVVLELIRRLRAAEGATK